jgi:hypothetical protein
MKTVNSILFIAIAILLIVNSGCIKYCDNCRGRDGGVGGTGVPCDTCQLLLPPPPLTPPNCYTN